MTDDLLRPAPDDPEPVDPHPKGDDPTEPEKPDEVGPETKVPTGDPLLQREGADAIDAADIEDPEHQI